MNKNIQEEIGEYKRINQRNNAIILVLSAILLFTFLVMIYVRFFG